MSRAGISAGTMLQVSGEAKVLICMARPITADQAQMIKDQLTPHFPGLEFFIISDATGLMAYDDLGGRL